MRAFKKVVNNEMVAGGQIDGAREYQEDALACYKLVATDGANDAVNDDAHLLILTDGMGGHVGGARASKLAIEGFASAMQNESRDAGFDDIPAALKKSLHAANDSIRLDVEETPANKDMGCTLIGVVVVHSVLYWVSVGDSPLWLLRDGEVTRLNADHSMRPVLESLVALNKMTQDELDADARVNQLRSAVFGGDISMIDSNDGLALQPSDKIILASDGVETLSVEEIAELSAGGNAEQIVTQILDAVVSAGKPAQDNATAIAYLHNC